MVYRGPQLALQGGDELAGVLRLAQGGVVDVPVVLEVGGQVVLRVTPPPGNVDDQDHAEPARLPLSRACSYQQRQEENEERGSLARDTGAILPAGITLAQPPPTAPPPARHTPLPAPPTPAPASPPGGTVPTPPPQRSRHADPHPAAHRHGEPEELLGKHKCHGLLVIALTDDRGRLLWVSATRPGRTSEITACRHDELTARLRAAGLGAIADLGFVGLDDSGPDIDPAVITGYKATRNRPLTRGQKLSNKALAAVRAPVEHGFAHLKNWRVLGRLRTDPKWATALVRALLVLTNREVSR
ncbi:transposase family protein [Streptomyces bingchenggensis]|uniref:transposase family protein n=1 Tax=Streptomyces TaxID=1883 RepID=UPI001EE641A4|nr:MULTISPECIES: transposase family protein [Streptomyces]